jgi:hypothetical protein
MGQGGAQLLCDVLTHLPEIVSQIPVGQRGDFHWEVAGENKWRTSIGADRLVLDISGGVADLKVKGRRWVTEGETGETESRELMRQAAKRVNNLLALAVARQMGNRLGEYVRQKANQRLQVQVRPVVTQQQRTAIRATTAVRLRMR